MKCPLYATIAYESYCSELKRQLELAQTECEQLRAALGSAKVSTDKSVRQDSGSEEVTCLFQSMTCLSVQLSSSSSEEKVFQCQLLDGLLKGNLTSKDCCLLVLIHVLWFTVGHEFTLTLDQSIWEYTYEPQKSTTALEDISLNFANSFVFPDYMLSRFLTNLLTANYGNSQT